MDPHATQPHAALLNEFVEEILELSARAHVRRRSAVKDSSEFHALTGAISAYGNVLALLTALRRLEEFYAKGGDHVPHCSQLAS